MLELVTHSRMDLASSDARHGCGLFETLRIEHGAILRLERHLARMTRGAAFLGLPEPPPVSQVRAFAERRIGFDAGVLRLFAVDGRMMVDARPMDLTHGGPVDVALARSVTRFSGSPLNRFKTLSYLENTLLAREAEAAGVFDVIALNERGQLTDGSRTSVFLVRGGELLTPAVCGGALPGVLREVLLEAGLGREVELTPDDLAEAEAVILCNSLRELLPVARVRGAGARDPAPAMLGRMRDAVAAAP